MVEESKQKWLAVMVNDLMSSEESGEDDTVTVHPLPWRSEYVNKMFQNTDKYSKLRKSPQASRQTKKRITGSPSVRPSPSKSDIPAWALS